MNDVDKFWAQLETQGEASVQDKLEKGLYGGDKKLAVEAWLKKKERERAEQAEKSKKSRQQMVDQEARDQAKFSRRIAVAALGISILGLLKDLFGDLIKYLQARSPGKRP